MARFVLQVKSNHVWFNAPWIDQHVHTGDQLAEDAKLA